MSRYPKILIPTSNGTEKEKQETAEISIKFKQKADNDKLITRAFNTLSSDKQLEKTVALAIATKFLTINLRGTKNKSYEPSAPTEEQIEQNDAFKTFQKKVQDIGYKTTVFNTSKTYINLTFDSME